MSGITLLKISGAKRNHGKADRVGSLNAFVSTAPPVELIGPGVFS